MAVLRNAIVGCIKQPINNLIGKIRFLRSCMMPLKPRQMRLPILIRPAEKQRIGQLKNDVMKVAREALAEQSFYVLENKAVRPQFANRANGLGKHVAAVLIRPVLATE